MVKLTAWEVFSQLLSIGSVVLVDALNDDVYFSGTVSESEVRTVLNAAEWTTADIVDSTATNNDPNPQYLTVGRHDVVARHVLGGTVPHDTLSNLLDVSISGIAVRNILTRGATKWGNEYSITTDGTFTANSDELVPTQRAILTYLNSLVFGESTGVEFKGNRDCSGYPNFPAANLGYIYRVSVAGKIGGSSGPDVEVGDVLFCCVNSSTSGDYATVGDNWLILQGNTTSSSSLELGETETTAYRGDRGKIAYDHSQASHAPSTAITSSGVTFENLNTNGDVGTGSDQLSVGNHAHTALDVGLGNVTNDAQIPLSQKGAASGVAELDSSGKVPSSQLPSYVDDVLEYADLASFPGTGESGIVYVAQDTNITYRWSGSAYVVIGTSLALGETESTAYRGDRGKIAYDHSLATHAPSDAQKNSDITKAEIETVLTGEISSHSHAEEVLEYADLASFPATGTAGLIYIAQDTNIPYHWSGSSYVAIGGVSSSLELGETESTAYRGDRGKVAYDHSQATHADTAAITSAGVTFENLNTNGDVGTGSDQLAVGNHAHSYEPEFLVVKSKSYSNPSTLTPSDGDVYILSADGTGDWDGYYQGNVVVYVASTTSWKFYGQP